MQVRDDAIQHLLELLNRDNFTEDKGTLYTGVHDPLLKARLQAELNSVIRQFVKAVQRGATKGQYLELLESGIRSFHRQELDTEDVERVAGNFEKIMDCIGLESSEGILNRWMYGFDPK